MRFGFLVTARCNAACTHCTTSCGPHESTALPKAKILGLMEEGASIWRQERAPGEDLHFSISGGEPFLDFAQLVELVAYGARLGASMSCVTNGYWAAGDERARAKLTALRGAGLAALAVSTSRFHQQFVKLERVERALRIAKDVGLHTTLKCALLASDRQPGGLEAWARRAGADALERFPVVPYLRRGAEIAEHEYIRRPGLPKGRCPAPTLTMREDGTAYTCCMPGAFVDFLSLGNVHELPLQQVYDRFYLQGKQQVLRHKGPIHFARAVIAAGEGRRLRLSYESVCDLCAHIASDPTMSAIAENAALRFAQSQYRAAVRRLAQRGQAPGNPESILQATGASNEKGKRQIATA